MERTDDALWGLSIAGGAEFDTALGYTHRGSSRRGVAWQFRWFRFI